MIWNSLFILIISNLIPLLGVTFWNWDLSLVLFLYWCESGIIGFFNILKMKKCTSKGPKEIGFFIAHFGGFIAGHLFFIISLFGKPKFDIFELFLALIFLFFSHFYSFIINFLKQKEYERIDIKSLFFAPYKRIIIMHLTLIFGAFLISITKWGVSALVLLIVLKTIADALAHLVSHRSLYSYKFTT